MGQPNIVWLTMDSIRFDRTTFSGYHRDTTPGLSKLVEMRNDALSFSQCYTHGIWTFASSSSILTGTPGSFHTAGVTNDVLPAAVPTVAERFSEAGYSTACISFNAHLSPATNLDRGFDRFAWLSKSTLLREAGLINVLKYMANLRHESAGFDRDTRKHTLNYLINNLLKDWVKELETRDSPFFIYAHYNDPHHPYCPPLPYRNCFDAGIDIAPDTQVEIAREMSDSLHERIAAGCDFTDTEWGAITTMYDSLLAYTDRSFSKLIDWLLERDDDTIIVATSDHGEFFGEYGLLAHMIAVTDEVAHVPLVILNEPSLAGTQENLIQHSDIMKVLLERAEANTEGMYASDPREEVRDVAITQRGPNRYRKKIDELRRHNPSFETDRYLDGLVTSARTRTHRVSISDSGEQTSLTDGEPNGLSADAASEHGIKDRVREFSEKWSPVKSAKESARMTPAMKRQLEDLGYL